MGGWGGSGRHKTVRGPPGSGEPNENFAPNEEGVPPQPLSTCLGRGAGLNRTFGQPHVRPFQPSVLALATPSSAPPRLPEDRLSGVNPAVVEAPHTFRVMSSATGPICRPHWHALEDPVGTLIGCVELNRTHLHVLWDPMRATMTSQARNSYLFHLLT